MVLNGTNTGGLSMLSSIAESLASAQDGLGREDELETAVVMPLRKFLGIPLGGRGDIILKSEAKVMREVVIAAGDGTSVDLVLKQGPHVSWRRMPLAIAMDMDTATDLPDVHWRTLAAEKGWALPWQPREHNTGDNVSLAMWALAKA